MKFINLPFEKYFDILILEILYFQSKQSLLQEFLFYIFKLLFIDVIIDRHKYKFMLMYNEYFLQNKIVTYRTAVH